MAVMHITDCTMVRLAAVPSVATSVGNTCPALPTLRRPHTRGGVVPLIVAVSFLSNLEAARRGRSMLFSDEQKLPFKGGKKGFAKNNKLDFMRR